MNLSKLYAALLLLYPYDYRFRFALEMRAAFAESLAELRSQSRRVVVGFVLYEIGALVIGAASEWVAKFFSDASVRGRSLPDLRRMRPLDITAEVWFAGTCMASASGAGYAELRDAEKRTHFLLQQMVDAIARREYEIARAYSYQERAERQKLMILRNTNSG